MSCCVHFYLSCWDPTSRSSALVHFCYCRSFLLTTWGQILPPSTLCHHTQAKLIRASTRRRKVELMAWACSVLRSILHACPVDLQKLPLWVKAFSVSFSELPWGEKSYTLLPHALCTNCSSYPYVSLDSVAYLCRCVSLVCVALETMNWITRGFKSRPILTYAPLLLPTS